MYSRKLDRQQFRHKCQKSLPQVFVRKTADIQKPGKDQHLVKIKTTRRETSYVALSTRTIAFYSVYSYGYITVFWGKLRNTTYVLIRHVRRHSISHNC